MHYSDHEQRQMDIKSGAQMDRHAARRAVTMWNAEISVGAPVDYRKDDGKIIQTHTRTPASVLGGHTAVVWVEGVSGCVALDRVTPRETPAI